MLFDSDVGQFKLGDGSFSSHQSHCEKCSTFDGEAKNLATLCLEGSVLWKAENVVAQTRGPIVRGEHWASKAQVKAAMRYKGEA